MPRFLGLPVAATSSLSVCVDVSTVCDGLVVARGFSNPSSRAVRIVTYSFSFSACFFRISMHWVSSLSFEIGVDERSSSVSTTFFRSVSSENGFDKRAEYGRKSCFKCRLVNDVFIQLRTQCVRHFRMIRSLYINRSGCDVKGHSRTSVCTFIYTQRHKLRTAYSTYDCRGKWVAIS